MYSQTFESLSFLKILTLLFVCCLFSKLYLTYSQKIFLCSFLLSWCKNFRNFSVPITKVVQFRVGSWPSPCKIFHFYNNFCSASSPCRAHALLWALLFKEILFLKKWSIFIWYRVHTSRLEHLPYFMWAYKL